MPPTLLARARLRWSALALASALVFAACGGDDPTAIQRPGTGSEDDEDGGALAPPPPPADGGATPDASRDGASGDGAAPQVFSGEATYYYASGTGACGQPLSDSASIGALNGAQYSKANCGRCAAIQGPSGSVTVKLLDKCPGCDHGDIDLSSSAFAKIAKLSAGRVKITWSFVDCP